MAKRARKKASAGQIVGKVFKILFCFVLIGLLITGAYYIIDITNDYRGKNFTAEEDIILVVEKGDTATKVANSLSEMGVLKYPDVFRLISKTENLDTKLQIGTFVIPKGSSYSDIYSLLKQNQNYRQTVRITFFEGCDVSEMLRLLLENGIGSSFSIGKSLA